MSGCGGDILASTGGIYVISCEYSARHVTRQVVATVVGFAWMDITILNLAFERFDVVIGRVLQF